jgi:hypothetical protein
MPKKPFENLHLLGILSLATYQSNLGWLSKSNLGWLSKRKQEICPMKALLRSSVLVLTVFAGYVACSAELKGGLNSINIPRPPTSPCAIGHGVCQR